MLKAAVLTGLALLTLASSADAASFDCKTHQKPDEVAICNDHTLSGLDRELAAIYGRLRASLTPEQASALRETQLNFLRSRRECGNNQGCLGALTDRLAELNAQASPDQRSVALTLKQPLGLVTIRLPHSLLMRRRMPSNCFSLSLRCPNKPIEFQLTAGTSRYQHDIYTFVGDKKTLRVKRTRRWGSGQPYDRTYASLFSRLVIAEQIPSDHYTIQHLKLPNGEKPSVVGVRCKDRYINNQATCFWDDADGDEYGYLPIFLCDADTAKNVAQRSTL